MIREGDAAPAFTLPDRPGHEVRVESGGRPIVLLFFPLAWSSVCTREMCTLRDDWEAWKALDADVYAISVDSPFVTAKFRDDHGLPFPVLSDFNRDVAGGYGVLYDDYFGLRGVAKRSAFVIAPGGRVSHAWVTDDSGQEPDYDEVRAAVTAAAGAA